MKKPLINIVGIPLLTFLLFVFECSDPQYYAYELLWSFCLALILWEGNGLIIRVLNKYVPWRQPAAPRIFIQLGISTLLTVWVTYFATYFLYDHLYEVHFSTLVFRRNLFLFLIISWLYNAIYTGGHFFKKWRTSIVEAEELKRQNLITQNEILKNQINPHFLFNSINTLIALIDESPKLAKEFGHHFSKIYRYILDHENDDLVTLNEELQVVGWQKELLKARFEKGLELSIEVNESAKQKLIPPLTIQMLVENAIKHNMISAKIPLIITIYTDEDYLVIKNNIQPGNTKEKSTKKGLENIRKRYNFFTEREIVILNDGSYFTVQLPMLNQSK